MYARPLSTILSAPGMAPRTSVSLGLVPLHVSLTEQPMHLARPLVKLNAVVFHAFFNQVAACLSLRLLSLSVFTSRSLSLLPSEKSTT